MFIEISKFIKSRSSFPSNFLTDKYYNPQKLRLTKITISENYIFTAIFHNMKKLLQNTFFRGGGGQFSRGNFPGGFISGGSFPGGIFPGGIFPSTDFRYTVKVEKTFLVSLIIASKLVAVIIKRILAIGKQRVKKQSLNVLKLNFSQSDETIG